MNKLVDTAAFKLKHLTYLQKLNKKIFKNLLTNRFKYVIMNTENRKEVLTMANTKTPTTIKNEIRTATFETMRIALGRAYGAENIYRIGDTEIAVKVAETPTGEPIYATFSPTIKDYCDRQTKTKTIKAFDLTAEVNAYEKTLAERKAKAEESAKNKAKKIESDKAKREATAKAKAEHAKRKADTLTAFKAQAANNVEVTYRPPKEG